jgi:hypothetical protein
MSVAARSQPRSRLRGYLAMARVSNSPTVVSNALVGAALVAPLALTTDLLITIVSLVLFYTAGMFLNDICDYEIDRKERAERPLVTGEVSLSEAWVITLVLFGVAIGLLLAVNVPAFIGGLVLTGLIVLYDTWHKKNIISPLIMGANRFMVYVIAAMAVVGQFQWNVVAPASLLLLYILGLTFVAKSETSSEAFTKFWPMLVVLAPAFYYGYQMIGTPIYLAMILVFVGWTIFAATFIYQDGRRSIGTAISFLLAGIALLDAMALASVGATWGIVVAVSCFALTLVFQRYIKGT